MNTLKIAFLTLSFVSTQAFALDNYSQASAAASAGANLYDQDDDQGGDEGDGVAVAFDSATIQNLGNRNYDNQPNIEAQDYNYKALRLTANSRQSIDIEYWATKALAIGLGAALGYITKSLHSDYKGTTQRGAGAKEVGKNLFKYALVFGSGAVISPIMLDEDSEIEKKDVALIAASAAAVFGGMHYNEKRAHAAKQDRVIAVAQAK